jgi:predicted ester cyclase
MNTLSPTAVYRRFLTALNSGDHRTIAEVIAPDFVDHHPGFDIKGIDSYQAALRDARESLRLRGELEEILEAGDRIVTRVRLTGKHVGTAFGLPATDRDVTWSTTEIWRVSQGVLVERWAQDDLLGLREQLSSDAVNIAVVQKVSDAVNSRRYDDLDDLFAPTFVDRNPAWDVAGLEELKGIIRAAHEALDFHVTTDQLYAADGDKVVMHITFNGRHIAPFFGQEPTGKAVSWTSIEVYRLENGKVAERWVQADTTGLMYQTGVPLPG